MPPTEPLSQETQAAADETADPAPRSKMLARLLDDSIPLPFTSFRIGIDPILGFLPGIGDAISACLGFTILYDAARCRVRKRSQLKIALNVLINAVFGALPVIGDIFSATFKSNARNYHILAEDFGDRHGEFDLDALDKPGFPWFASGLIGLVLGLLALVVWGLVSLVRLFF